MIEFLINVVVNIWTFIMDNLVSIIAVSVAIIGILFGLKRKGFSYYIESANAVVSVEEKMADQVKVFLGDRQIENAHLIAINIRNSGNQSIEEKDFVDDISFNFGEDALFLRAAVVETDPRSLYPVFTHIHGTPVLLPLLLNRGDNFTVNFLVSNWDPDAFEIRGRIIGVKDIKFESAVSGVTRAIAYLAMIPLVITLFSNFGIITSTQSIFFLLSSFILMLIMVVTSRKSIRRYRANIKKIRSYLER